MNKNSIFCTALVVALSNVSNAAEVGFGVSGFQRGAEISIPIKINNRYRIEPFTMILVDERESKDLAGRGPDSTYKFNLYGVGLGLYKTRSLRDNIATYYGTKIAYTKGKSENKWVENAIISDTTGYTISPTLGFEYYLTEQFLLGIEGGVTYSSDVENTSNHQETTSIPVQVGEVKRKNFATTSAIVVRYFF